VVAMHEGWNSKGVGRMDDEKNEGSLLEGLRVWMLAGSVFVALMIVLALLAR